MESVTKPVTRAQARKLQAPEPQTLAIMHSIGYVHETEVEDATNTTPRSRARWQSPRGVMFGNEKYYPLVEIKRHMDARSAYADPDDRPAIL